MDELNLLFFRSPLLCQSFFLHISLIQIKRCPFPLPPPPPPPPFWFYISSCSSFNPAHTIFLLTPFYCTIRFRFACLSFSSVHKSVDQHILKLCSVLYFYIMPLFADHHILTLCTTLFYFSLLQLAYRLKISDTPSRFVIITASTHKICSVSKTFIAMHPPCGRSPPVYFLPNSLSERSSRLS